MSARIRPDLCERPAMLTDAEVQVRRASQDADVLGLDPDTDLIFPMHKSALVQDGVGDTGEPELQIFYGIHVVCFDEPETFAFGEALARHGRFRAGEALDW